MKIFLVCIGKIKEKELKSLQENYLKRLKHYSFELIELPDGKGKTPEVKLKEERLKFEKAIESFQKIILLDENGIGRSSKDFSQWINAFQNQSTKSLAFLMGSSHGFDKLLKEKISSKFQISKMTLTHEMARIIFLEQLYRAYTILEGIPYHH